MEVEKAKELRDRAEKRIKTILTDLQVQTGMTVEYIGVDAVELQNGDRAIRYVRIDLEL